MFRLVYGFSIEAGVTTTPAAVRLLLRPARVKGGKPVRGTVLLSAPAPAGGLEVLLKSSDPNTARPPERVRVPAGSKSAGFTVRTFRVRSLIRVEITAHAGAATPRAMLEVRK